MLSNSEYFNCDNDINGKHVFDNIDKDEEDADVMEYQRTKNDSILEKVYHNRMPTLRVWANKYHYMVKLSVDNSYRNQHDVEEMYRELTRVFLKAVNGYKDSYKVNISGKIVTKKTPFNTYLFFAFDNHIKNLISNKNAKKRKPLNAEQNTLHHFIYSLDLAKEEGSKTTKDTIADQNTLSNSAIDNMYLEETIDLLAKEDVVIKKFLKDLSDGSTMVELLRKYKIKEGQVKLSNDQSNKLKKRASNKIAKKIINENSEFEHDFKLLRYDINCNIMKYTIEMEKTNETDKIIKSMRNFRKNKVELLAEIYDS